MLLRIFKCGPESARENEYRGYMSSKALPTYAMCRSDGHASLKKVAVAAHVATVILEGSDELRKDFVQFVRTRYPAGEEMVQLGEALVKCVRSADIELLNMTRAQLDELMISMLADLKNILDSLETGMTVKVGSVQPLKVKFNQRCTTVAHVDFCEPSSTPIVSVTAGGFGSGFGARTGAEPGGDNRARRVVGGAGFGAGDGDGRVDGERMEASCEKLPHVRGIRSVMLSRSAGCGCCSARMGSEGRI